MPIVGNRSASDHSGVGRNETEDAFVRALDTAAKVAGEFAATDSDKDSSELPQPDLKPERAKAAAADHTCNDVS